MSPSRAALSVLTWLLVVAAGSTLVWTVISRAGEQVAGSSGALVAATGGPASPGTTRPPSSPAPSGSPPQQTQQPRATPAQRTWQGLGGLVVAQCDGAAISRVSLLPDNGYAVELKDNGPEQLEVVFEGRENENGREAKVTARCVNRVPVFESAIDD